MDPLDGMGESPAFPSLKTNRPFLSLSLILCPASFRKEDLSLSLPPIWRSGPLPDEFKFLSLSLSLQKKIL